MAVVKTETKATGNIRMDEQMRRLDAVKRNFALSFSRGGAFARSSGNGTGLRKKYSRN
jgi:hypothetical protein